MKKSTKPIKDSPKKIGRPATTGRGKLIAVRMHKHQLEAIEAWRASRETEVSLPEAIRRLALSAASLFR